MPESAFFCLFSKTFLHAAQKIWPKQGLFACGAENMAKTGFFALFLLFSKTFLHAAQKIWPKQGDLDAVDKINLVDLKLVRQIFRVF